MTDDPLEAIVVDDRPPVTSGWREMVDRPWIVLTLLFLVTGALGLPLLWSSRAFSGISKIVLTIAVLLYTALLFYLVYIVLVWSYGRVSEVL